MDSGAANLLIFLRILGYLNLKRLPSLIAIAMLAAPIAAAAQQSGFRANPEPPPQIETGAAQQVLEIPIPEMFLGCWRGDVDDLEWERRADWLGWFGLPTGSRWYYKRYRLCFTRIDGRHWQLSFGALRFAQAAPVKWPRHHVELIGLVPPDRFELESDFTFMDSTNLSQVGELTKISATLLSDGSLDARGMVFATLNEAPWFTAAWRTRLLPELQGQ